jgi:hypothetical protein
MTAKDLIKELQKFDENLEVAYSYDGGYGEEWVEKVELNISANGLPNYIILNYN